jgi:hypothetical protein
MITTRIATLLLLAAGLVSARQQTTAASPALDRVLQDRIHKLLDAKSESDQRAALDRLRAEAGPAYSRLVPQLFLFSEAARDTRDAMAMGFVLRELAIEPRDVIAAMVPLLESDDPARRAAVGNVLSEYEDRSIDRGASFSAYREILEHGRPTGLVRHMLEVDPGAAFLAVLRAEVRDPAELRPLLWAWHQVTGLQWERRFGYVSDEALARGEPREPRAQLAMLAAHPRWWARAFAARVAREEPLLLGDARASDLVSDPHPLVRELAGQALQQAR